MAKNPRKPTTPTKKHLARMERERLQTRYILIGSAIVLILVVGVIVYGILDQTVLRDIRPVAIVNGEKITTEDFRAFTKYTRYQLIQGAAQTYQIAQIFGGDPNTVGSFVSQLEQIQQQLNPERAGDQALNLMIDDLLIRQEAAKRGITVAQEEVEEGVQAALEYYPDGTYTPTPTFESLPTSTLSPLQLTLIPPTASATITPTIPVTATSTITATALTATETPTQTATPTASEVLTPTATATITPSPTPYTFEGFQKTWQEIIDSYEENEIPEETLRRIMESSIYRQKMMKEVLGDLPPTEEQVWALHILVDDETTAKDIYTRLMEGEDWSLMAKAYSKDTSNNLTGGDLGWFSRGAMVAEFEEAAFNLKVGETSQPVQSQFGWHIIRVLGHENRPITTEQYQQLREKKFSDWLTDLRSNSEVEIKDYWNTMVPLQPTLPAEIITFIQQFQAQPTNPAGQP
jgi:parvulin-like peptidyl-prolyl isomerase